MIETDPFQLLQILLGACVVVLITDIDKRIGSVLTVRILSREDLICLKQPVIPALLRLFIVRLFGGFTEELRTCRDSIQRFGGTLVSLVHKANLLVFFNRFLKLLRGIVGFADMILPESSIVGTRITTHHITEDFASGNEITHRFFGHLTVNTDLHPPKLKVRCGSVIQCSLRVLAESI